VEDLDRHFGEHMEELSSLPYFQQFENLHDEILGMYDGYSWDGVTRMFNPFSLLSFFTLKNFGYFWYGTGSPGLLVDLIRKDPETYTDIGEYTLRTGALDDALGIDVIQTVPLMFQTGYLTVDEAMDGPRRAWSLKVPNLEVREAFNAHLLAAVTSGRGKIMQSLSQDIKKALQDGDLDRMLTLMKSIFASIPYELHMSNESYYHTIFYIIMSYLGFEIDAEVSTSRGRIDAVLELADCVYVFEFKYVDCKKDANARMKRRLSNKALKEGEKQIRDRGYADRFMGRDRKVVRAAFAFLGRDEIVMKVLR
jgi:hypothetical protein